MRGLRNPSGTSVVVLVKGLGIEDVEIVGIVAATGNVVEEDDAGKVFELAAEGDQGLNKSCFG